MDMNKKDPNQIDSFLDIRIRVLRVYLKLSNVYRNTISYQFFYKFLQRNYDESFRFLCTNIYCFRIPLFHHYLEFSSRSRFRNILLFLDDEGDLMVLVNMTRGFHIILQIYETYTHFIFYSRCVLLRVYEIILI